MTNLAALKVIAEELEGMHDDLQGFEQDMARTERARFQARMPEWQYKVCAYFGHAKAEEIFRTAPDAAHRRWLFGAEASRI